MYAFTVDLRPPFADAVSKVIEALKAEKLGIVSDVDVQAIMKGKLGLEFPGYRILGGCAAGLARRVIEADANAGALLPCSVVVRESGDKVVVAFMNPRAVLGLADHEQVTAVAEEAYETLQRVKHHLLGDA